MPIAPRPSSPTISYLPAFVTVGIPSIDLLSCKTALAIQTLMTRIGLRLRKETHLEIPPSLLAAKFVIFTRGNASADTRAPYPDSTHRIFSWSTLLGY